METLIKKDIDDIIHKESPLETMTGAVSEVSPGMTSLHDGEDIVAHITFRTDRDLLPITFSKEQLCRMSSAFQDRFQDGSMICDLDDHSTGVVCLFAVWMHCNTFGGPDDPTTADWTELNNWIELMIRLYAFGDEFQIAPLRNEVMRKLLPIVAALHDRGLHLACDNIKLLAEGICQNSPLSNFFCCFLAEEAHRYDLFPHDMGLPEDFYRKVIRLIHRRVQSNTDEMPWDGEWADTWME